MPTSSHTSTQSVQWPAVSLAMATYNSSRTLEEALASIRAQDYPAEIEIVIADGGSTDKTLEIAKKFNAKIVTVPKDKQNAEYNKGVAIQHTKHEILLMTDHDNILPNKHWLKAMVQPLVDDPEIFGSGVLRFTHDPSMNILDRYFSLIGSPDPVPFFLNKSGHQSWLYDGFHLRGTVIDEKPGYYVVKLDKDRMPALGGNGSVLRKSLLKQAQADPDHFFHIDVHVDLARKGYTKYAFVKESIKHLSNNSVIPFLMRRKYFIEKYHFADHSRRRYSIYEPDKDKKALLLYIVYAATFIGPISAATRGFIKKPDIAWYLHPIMCFAMLVIYGYPTIREETKRVLMGK